MKPRRPWGKLEALACFACAYLAVCLAIAVRRHDDWWALYLYAHLVFTNYVWIDERSDNVRAWERWRR